MKATIEIGQPSRTPHAPASPPKTRRYGWFAGSLAVLGLGVGIWWGIASYVGMLDRISAFERIPIPSSEVSVTSEPGTKVLYVEDARRTPVPALRFAVVDPSGRAVAVQTYEAIFDTTSPASRVASGGRWPPSRQVPTVPTRSM